MVSVGGIFHDRAGAQQCADALALAGVERESIRAEILPRSPKIPFELVNRLLVEFLG